MKFKVDSSKNFLILYDCTSLEYDQLCYSFTKIVDNYFVIKKRVPWWDGKVSFFDTKFNRIPISLWREVQKLCKEFHFSLEIEGIEDLYDKNFDEVNFTEWVNTYFEESEDLIPRDYQIEACLRLLKYRKCTSEIATSGGKTLVAFMIFKYLFNKGLIKKMLYIAPKVDLVSQPEEKFYEYEERCNKKPNWKALCVYSGVKKTKDTNQNIIFGTYQSLGKKDLTYFEDFDIIIVDECLHPDTLITMSDFSKKKIKDIKIGEKVWTKNEKTNKYEIKEIEYVYKNLFKNQQMYEIELENGNTIKITGNHKVLLKNNLYKRVDKLNECDEIDEFLI